MHGCIGRIKDIRLVSLLNIHKYHNKQFVQMSEMLEKFITIIGHKQLLPFWNSNRSKSGIRADSGTNCPENSKSHQYKGNLH